MKPMPDDMAQVCAYPTDLSAAATNEQSAAQMDQPRPRDSITIAINPAPAPNRGPLSWMKRWGFSTIETVR
jgi:hypothetical protein